MGGFWEASYKELIQNLAYFWPQDEKIEALSLATDLVERLGCLSLLDLKRFTTGTLNQVHISYGCCFKLRFDSSRGTVALLVERPSKGPGSVQLY